MLATLVTPAVNGAANYGTELTGAYEYAFSKGITTMTSIDNANMYGEITRGQLAKMISNWAEKELGTKVDATKVCSFTDTNTAEGDLAAYLTKSCQMGLMGQGIDAFRPNAKVTRGEFGTTLSRALWGNKFDGATPFYANHLQALKDAGIMTKIENPSQLEIRGYVMLMLQRSTAESLINKVVNTGTNNTGANGVVKAGDLKVTATAATNRRILNGATSDLDTLTFSANENITLDKVVLERYGYSDKDAIESVWLEDQNGKQVASEKNVNSKDEVNLVIAKNSREIGKNATFTIVVKLTDQAVNKTIGFKVKSVESSAKNLDISSYTPFTYDVVNYAGGKLELTMRSATKTYNYVEGNTYEIARFQVKPTGPSVSIKGFSLKNVVANNALELRRYLNKVEVVAGGKTLSNVKYEFDRDDKLVLTFDAVEAEMKKNMTFEVKASFKELRDLPRNIQLQIEKTTDLNAVEVKNGVRVEFNIAGTNAGLYKIHGAQVKFTNTKLATSIDASAGTTNVVVGSGKVELDAPITVSDLSLRTTNGEYIENMYLVVDNAIYDAKQDKVNKNLFSFSSVDFSKSSNVQLKVDLKDNAPVNTKISFTNLLDGAALVAGHAKYEESRDLVQVRDILGSINLSSVVVREGKGALDNTLTKTANIIANETTTRTLFDGSYIAKKQDVILNQYGITGDALLGANEYVTFHLYINGNEVSTMKLTNDAIGETNSFSNITVKNGEKVSVKVVADAYLKAGTTRTFTLGLYGENEDGKAAGSDTAAMVKVESTQNGKVNLYDTASNRFDAIVKNTNQTLAKFTVKPLNSTDSVRLDNLQVVVKKDGTQMTVAQLLAKKFQVKVNGVSYDVDADAFDTTDVNNIYIKDINETVESGGVVVEVLAREALDEGKYEVTLQKPNKEATKSMTAKKQVFDALVRFTKMENFGGDTKFTVVVSKYEDDTTVGNLKVYYSKGTDEQSKVLEPGTFEGERVFSTPAVDSDNNYTINKVTFEINGTEKAITSTEFSDYFKVDGLSLRIFRS